MLRVLVWAGLVVSAVTDERVVGFLGEDGDLPCHLPPDTEVSMLEWLRPDLGPDGYLLFYREHREYRHYQHPRFSHRVVLVRQDLKDGDLSVTLHNLTLRDTGTYSCVVRTSDRSTVSSSVHLEVTPRPRTEKLVDRVLLPVDSAVRWADPEETPGPGVDRRRSAAWAGAGLCGAVSVALAVITLVQKRLKLSPTEPSQTVDTL